MGCFMLYKLQTQQRIWDNVDAMHQDELPSLSLSWLEECSMKDATVL